MFSKITKLADKAVGKVKTIARGGPGNGNARNNATVQEMKVFKEHVKELVRLVQECLVTLSVTSSGISKVLGQQLPRAFVNASAGTGVEAFSPEVQMVGTGVQLEVLTQASTEMTSKITMEVIKPLEKWLADFSAIKDRNHKCEALSEELQAQKKSATSAEESARDLQAKGHKNAAAAAQKAATEKDKEKRLEEQFIVMEAEIFNEMLTSIKEIQELRKYALSALKGMQACLQQSVNSFDVSIPIVIKLPNPESTTVPVQVQDHGAAAAATAASGDQGDVHEPPLPNPFVGAAPAYMYTQAGVPPSVHPGGVPSAPEAPNAPPAASPYPGMYGAPPAYPGYEQPAGLYPPPQAGGYPAPQGPPGAYPAAS